MVLEGKADQANLRRNSRNYVQLGYEEKSNKEPRLLHFRVWHRLLWGQSLSQADFLTPFGSDSFEVLVWSPVLYVCELKSYQFLLVIASTKQTVQTQDLANIFPPAIYRVAYLGRMSQEVRNNGTTS